MSTAPFYYENFSVGQRFRSPRHTIDAAAIKSFASLYDPQPQHLDETAAARGFFGGLIASGWQTASLTMRLIVGGGLPPVVGGLIGAGVERISWPRPVRPGNTLQAETEILELRPSRSKPAFGLVRFRTRTLNENGEVVQDMTSILFAPRRPAAASGQAGMASPSAKT